MSVLLGETMSFDHSLRVRFREVDRAAIVFYGRVFEYAHVAFEEFILALGLDLDTFFDHAEWVVPITHASADYRQPMKHGQQLTCTIDVMDLRNSAFSLRYRFNSSAGVHVDATTVHVFVDRQTFNKRDIPADIRARLQPHLIDAKS